MQSADRRAVAPAPLKAVQLWPADKVERRAVAELVPYARNARVHSDAQVAEIAASIREWGWTIPVLVDEQGTIIAGHARIMAASKLGLTDVPCMTATGWTEAQRRAYVLADNKLALNAEWDDDLLKIELADLTDAGFDLSLTGFDEVELTNLFDPPTSYSRKVEAPIYTPSDDPPAISELIDTDKTDSLKAAILSAPDLPDEVRDFLLIAAERHTVFNFHHIADFYASAAPEVQRLFEVSGLVIIDLDAAIENGFVQLNQMLLDFIEGADDEG